MFHSLAYTTAIGAVANTDVPALQDDIVQIQNNHFILSQFMRLLAALVYSPTIIDAQIKSPTIQQINPSYIRPVNASAIATGNPGVAYQFGGGLQLTPFEETQILGSAAPGATERFTALLYIADVITPTPVGSVYVARWSSTGAAVANAWTTIALNLTSVLPSGQYAMVQSEHWSTNAIAHRFIFSNQYWRPGYPSMVSPTTRLPDQLLVSTFGLMGVFKSNDLPRLQVLCNAADAVHTGTIWLVRTGNL